MPGGAHSDSGKRALLKGIKGYVDICGFPTSSAHDKPSGPDIPGLRTEQICRCRHPVMIDHQLLLTQSVPPGLSGKRRHHPLWSCCRDSAAFHALLECG